MTQFLEVNFPGRMSSTPMTLRQVCNHRRVLLVSTAEYCVLFLWHGFDWSMSFQRRTFPATLSLTRVCCLFLGLNSVGCVVAPGAKPVLGATQ